MNAKKILLILGAVLGLVLIIAIVGKKAGVVGGTKATEVAVEEVEERTILETVEANGKIYPETEVKLSPEVPGEITAIYVEEGDSVVKGQLLLEINPSLYQSSVLKAEAFLNQMRASQATAEANLTQVEVAVDNATAEHSRNQPLFQKGIISASEWEKVEANYKTALANKESAFQNVKAAQYNVKSAQASYQEALDNLGKTTILAPMNGIISALNVEEGETVVGTSQMAGTELLRIADLNNMEARVDVSENDVLRLSIGDTVRIEVDAYQDREFVGLVSEIAYSTGSDGMMLTSEQVTNFEVGIKLLRSSYADLISPATGHAYPFRPGMSASVDIETEKAGNVVAVPIQAVTTRDNVDEDSTAVKSKSGVYEVVFVVENGKARMVPVKTGIQDASYIEVLSGLKAGDQIVTAPFKAIAKGLEDGDAVTIVKESQLFD